MYKGCMDKAKAGEDGGWGWGWVGSSGGVKTETAVFEHNKKYF